MTLDKRKGKVKLMKPCQRCDKRFQPFQNDKLCEECFNKARNGNQKNRGIYKKLQEKRK